MNGLITRYLIGTKKVLTPGDIWTSRVSGTTQSLQAIAWSGTKFIVVGQGGTILASTNGIDWTLVTSGTTNFLYDVIYAYGKFIAVGASGTILTSVDGTTWSAISSGVSNNLDSISYANDKLFIGADNSGLPYRTLVSNNGGTSWYSTYSTTVCGNLVGFFTKVLWDGTKYIGYGYTGGFSGGFAYFGSDIFTSIDGSSWGSELASASSIFDVKYYKGMYIACGTGIQSSSDGINFSSVYTAVSANALIESSSNRLIIPASASVGVQYYTDNGTTWQTRSIPTMNTSGLVAANNLLVSVGSSGKIFTS